MGVLAGGLASINLWNVVPVRGVELQRHLMRAFERSQTDNELSLVGRWDSTPSMSASKNRTFLGSIALAVKGRNFPEWHGPPHTGRTCPANA